MGGKGAARSPDSVCAVTPEPADLPGVDVLLHAAVRALGGTERPGQITMAHEVAAAMESEQHLLVQAGTGTGKSLAYLVPALRHALATDQPVVVATATLALQAQLVDRDLPRLSEAVEPLIGRPLRWATLKGRANYACLFRVHDGVPDDQGVLVMPETVGAIGAEVLRGREWAKEQAQERGTGDRDRLDPGVSDRAWRQVSVSPRECLGGTRCPYGSDCFAERSRREALGVDIVVTNHALLAVDAIEGLTVLPEHDVVVIDEGHELVARVTSVVTDELWPGVVERAAKRVRKFVDDGDADRLHDAADLLRDAAGTVEAGRLDVIPDELLAAVVAVRDAARMVQSGLARSADGTNKAADGEAVRKQAKALVDETFSTAERIAANGEHDVVWLETSERAGAVLRVAPLSVAGLLRHRMFAKVTGVLTSATLAIGGSFDGVARSVGLGPAPVDGAADEDDARASFTGIDVGSPFDYRRQAMLYVARHLPTPGRDGLTTAVLDELAALVEAAGGRTLGLFSSRRAAEQAAEAVRERLPDLPLLCQGDDLVPTLVRRFAADAETSLFGTLSLWQGVDVPGSSCQLVVIDRLPFPRPDDPLMSARLRAVERAGGNGFMSVAAAHAGLLLAQGTGRLIRHLDDRGVVAVLDPRLATARYAGFLRASLPPMWPTTDRAVVLGALRRLAGPAQAGVAGQG